MILSLALDQRNTLILPILKMKKLRLRKGKSWAPGLTLKIVHLTREREREGTTGCERRAPEPSRCDGGPNSDAFRGQAGDADEGCGLGVRRVRQSLV